MTCCMGRACSPEMCNVRNIQTAVHWLGAACYYPLRTKGQRCLPPYLPLRISCCLMFFMKWTFLKLFGRGEPDRVRHLKCKTKYRHVKKQRNCVRHITLIWKALFRQKYVIAKHMCMVYMKFTTCVEVHSPQCPQAFQAKSAERWVFV